MSVDDDLPWDEDAESPSWYDAADDSRWDPDDDGLPQIADDPNRDDGAEVVLYRFGEPGGVPEGPGSTPPEDDPPEPAPLREMPRRPSGVIGLAAGAISGVSRFVADTVASATGQEHPELTRAMDTVVGVGNGVTSVAGAVAGTAGRLARPVVDIALHPPLIPAKWHPGGLLEQVESAGRRSRLLGEDDAVSLAAAIIPAILDAVLDRIDLTQLVLDRVDLDRVVKHVDLDAAVERVDLGKVIERIDIDAILAKVDIDGVIATVDLNKVIERIDIDAILAKVDIDGVIATVDLQGVISRVDVNAVAATIDVDAIIDRVDLAGIAEDVIDEIDLPRIIRESSGSIASEAMVGVRLTSASADDQIGRLMRRLRLRRREPDDDPTLLDVEVAPLPPRRRLLRGGSGAVASTEVEATHQVPESTPAPAPADPTPPNPATPATLPNGGPT